MPHTGYFLLFVKQSEKDMVMLNFWQEDNGTSLLCQGRNEDVRTSLSVPRQPFVNFTICVDCKVIKCTGELIKHANKL